MEQGAWKGRLIAVVIGVAALAIPVAAFFAQQEDPGGLLREASRLVVGSNTVEVIDEASNERYEVRGPGVRYLAQWLAQAQPDSSLSGSKSHGSITVKCPDGELVILESFGDKAFTLQLYRSERDEVRSVRMLGPESFSELLRKLREPEPPAPETGKE